MSEEKKAIVRAREHIKDPVCNYLSDKEIEILLNFIDKQQKELEEVRQANKRLFEMGKDKAMTKLTNEIIENEYISKNKIRDKIKEYREQRIKLADGHFFDNPDNTSNDFALFIGQEVLKELLEE